MAALTTKLYKKRENPLFWQRKIEKEKYNIVNDV